MGKRFFMNPITGFVLIRLTWQPLYVTKSGDARHEILIVDPLDVPVFDFRIISILTRPWRKVDHVKRRWLIRNHIVRKQDTIIGRNDAVRQFISIHEIQRVMP